MSQLYLLPNGWAWKPESRSQRPRWECIPEFGGLEKCFSVCRGDVCIPTETVGTRVVR